MLNTQLGEQSLTEGDSRCHRTASNRYCQTASDNVASLADGLPRCLTGSRHAGAFERSSYSDPDYVESPRHHIISYHINHRHQGPTWIMIIRERLRRHSSAWMLVHLNPIILKRGAKQYSNSAVLDVKMDFRIAGAGVGQINFVLTFNYFLSRVK